MTMRNSARKLVPPLLLNWYRTRLGRNRIEERELHRLRSLPRYQAGTTTLLGRPLDYVDAASVVSAYEAIFRQGIYDFRPRHDAPRILDCGANIGLASLWWHRRFPAVRITAFEPDPDVWVVLQRNLRTHGAIGVEPVCAALWTQAGERTFRREGADAGHLTDTRRAPTGDVAVRTLRLRDLLDEPVDLLKLDVEGSEAEILLDCADALGEVENVFVEWHALVGVPQRLDEILAVLRASGFRVHLQPEMFVRQPFLGVEPDAYMDNRVNVFAWR